MPQWPEVPAASCVTRSSAWRMFRVPNRLGIVRRDLGGIHFVHAFILGLVCLLIAPQLRADTISGTVKDPSGAVVVGARIEITGGNLVQPLVLTSDGTGKFVAPNLNAGKYSVHVIKEGFDAFVTAVELQGTADVPVKLTITAQQTSVTVTDKVSGAANSDVYYRQLRDLGLGDTFQCDNVMLPVDVGNFEFKSGTLTFLGKVNDLETGAVFVGQGHFTLKPIAILDINEMNRRAGSPTA
jgi:hypothetical protein